VRVLHIQKVTGIGGSERHLLELLPSLVSTGVEVRMCVLGAGAYALFSDALRDRGVDVDVLPAGPDVNPLLVGKIARRIRAFAPDLVHTHLIHADLHGQVAARLMGVPAISSIHSAHAFYRREPYRSAARVAGHLARRTIAISKNVEELVQRVGVARRGTVRMVHYGIDVAGWELPEDARSVARAGFGVGADDIAVGIASRLIPLKGHDFLLDAFALARREVEGMQLLIAGDGPLRGELAIRAENVQPTGAARLVGFVHDIRSFMGACDIVVFPSLPGFGEGFGLAALEAMAAGRPVVATATDSLPEIVLDGETGCLVTPGSVEDLAEALVKLARDEGLRRRLGAGARERARTDFSLEAMVERTIAVYDEALLSPGFGRAGRSIGRGQAPKQEGRRS
jgi:glycosyltransferase involved in cell wall biosynthesis